MPKAICKKCIHRDICDAYTGEETIPFFSYSEDCKYFKNIDDYSEVRHGKWEEELDGTHYCSECGRDATYTYDGAEICGITCPFCGTKMDGKDDFDE